jgi:hypothetical protein
VTDLKIICVFTFNTFAKFGNFAYALFFLSLHKDQLPDIQKLISKTNTSASFGI